MAPAALAEDPVAVTGVSLGESAKNIVVDETYQINATITLIDATNKSVTWTSSDSTIAAVSPSGLVTGVKAGTANITVTTADGNLLLLSGYR
jgi:uncharacterized protein YjdB